MTTTVEADREIPTLEDEAHSYALLVDEGITARKAMDTGRWLIGEYARTLVTYYREKTIEEYARDIGVAAKRVYEYGAMASFYPLDIREHLSELDLTYSHFREARRLKDLNRAIDFLRAAALNLWTVEDMAQNLKTMSQLERLNLSSKYSEDNHLTDHTNKPVDPSRPRPVWEGITTLTVKNGRVTFAGTLPPDFDPDRAYKIIIEPIED
jgi:hypothetical protein